MDGHVWWAGLVVWVLGVPVGVVGGFCGYCVV